MAGKILSVEIEDSITYVLEMDAGVKNPKIYHFFSFETPEQVVSDDGVEIQESFVNQLRRGMEDNKIHTTKVIFTIASSRIANRDVTIPYVKDNRIMSLLTSNSKEYFPVDLAQYQLVYRILDKINEKDKKSILLSVFAVPNALIESYYKLATACGLQVAGLDYTGNSIYQAMLKTMSKDLAVTLRVETRNSMLTIVRNGKIILQRSIGYGIDEAIETIQNSGSFGEHLSYEDALGLLRRKTFLYRSLREEPMEADPEEKDEQAVVELRGEVTQSLVMLIGNISRVIGYFLSTNQDLNLEKVQLIGLGADCSGLSKLLTNELNVKVVALQQFEEGNLNKSIQDEKFKVAEYVACIGATFDPLNFSIENEKIEGVSRKRKDSILVPLVVFGTCVAASVGMMVIGTVSNSLLRSENKMLQTRIDAKQSVVETYNEYVRTKALYDGMVSLDTLSNTTNDEFLTFLSEMESKMPSDLLLSNLSASPTGITMSVTTGSKQTAAEALAALRTFSSVYGVQCSGITEQTDETGSILELFDVTVTYNDMNQMEVEDETEHE